MEKTGFVERTTKDILFVSGGAKEMPFEVRRPEG